MGRLCGGISALDIAERLINFNRHAPTIYFPRVVHEALTVEPTETKADPGRVRGFHACYPRRDGNQPWHLQGSAPHHAGVPPRRGEGRQ